MKFILILVFGLLFCTSCGPGESSGKIYDVLVTEPSNKGGHRQLILKAILTKESATDEEMRVALLEMYEQAKQHDIFDGGESTLIGIYLYPSAQRLTEVPSGFSAMLMKAPADSDPEISFSAFHDSGSSAENRAGFEALSASFESKGGDVCKMFYAINALSKEATDAADAKFGKDYSMEYHEYRESYYERRTTELLREYNMPDSVASLVMIYGPEFCK